MNTPDKSPALRRSSMSPEALVGTGVTIASLGGLFLLLGWAQWMRQVESASLILLVLGAVLALAGIVVAMVGRGRKSG